MSYSLKGRLSQLASDRQDAMEAMRVAVQEKEADNRWLGKCLAAHHLPWCTNIITT